LAASEVTKAEEKSDVHPTKNEEQHKLPLVVLSI
jgi:hypothetical protein